MGLSFTMRALIFPSMREATAGAVLVIAGCFVLGFVTGAYCLSRDHSAQVGDVIAMDWGDGKYGKAFYGAQVYVVPAGARFIVRAQIHIGYGNGYLHDGGVLGIGNSFEEAVQKWGKIEWRPDGLHVGDYFMSRARVESHR